MTDHYAEFLASECKDIETPSWITVESAFAAGLAARERETEDETAWLIEMVDARWGVGYFWTGPTAMFSRGIIDQAIRFSRKQDADAVISALLIQAPRLNLESCEHMWPRETAKPAPINSPAVLLVCKQCGADRAKEDCKGADRLNCDLKGMAQSTAEPSANTATYWLIERDSPVKYFQSEYYGSVVWTADPHDAMKFSSREMAEGMVRGTILHVEVLRICDLVFIEESAVGVQACRPEDRAMLQTEAGKELVRCAIESLTDSPSAHLYYESAEREHLGDPVKKTGIYANTEGAAQSQEPVAHAHVYSDGRAVSKSVRVVFRDPQWPSQQQNGATISLYTHPLADRPEGWKVRVSEDEYQSWLIVEHPTLGGAAFSCERGSVRAEVLQEFSIALINAAAPPAAPKDAEDRT